MHIVHSVAAALRTYHITAPWIKRFPVFLDHTIWDIFNQAFFFHLFCSLFEGAIESMQTMVQWSDTIWKHIV